MPESTSRASETEALQALQERLDRAAAAAERLIEQAAGGSGVPPRGWQRSAGAAGAGSGDGRAAPPRDGRAAPPRDGRAARPRDGWISGEDAELLLGLLGGVREFVPVELAQRLVAAMREVLLALRALIDWCLERAERRHTQPVEVQDIPIL